MILSPVEILIAPSEIETLKGALLDKEHLDSVIRIIENTNADGLNMKDAVVLMELKNASENLASSPN